VRLGGDVLLARDGLDRTLAVDQELGLRLVRKGSTTGLRSQAAVGVEGVQRVVVVRLLGLLGRVLFDLGRVLAHGFLP
jgi:hypothetical protein